MTKRAKSCARWQPRTSRSPRTGTPGRSSACSPTPTRRRASHFWWTAAEACARRRARSSRRICDWLLSTLDQKRDDASLFSFDTRLLTLREFTGSVEHVRDGLKELGAWGATSIYDAIAGASAIVAERASNRRAVIVLTDGADNWSAYTPQEVAWIASTIDVPVYVFAVGDGVNAEAGAANPMANSSPLAELARSTGGDFFIAHSPALAIAGITRLVDELRHQYLIAFEPSSAQGMRRIDITTRKADLKVSSRRWYTGSGTTN